jgi:hypothetical protein
MKPHLSLLTLLLISTAAPAQGSILFAMDGNEVVLDGAGGLAAASLLREDEVGIVTPTPAGGYSASTFLSLGAQWAFLGDADLDGRYADASTTGPGDDTDAVFVKRVGGTGGSSQRDVYFSKEGTAGFASGFEDGDVFRYATQGTIETFVTEVDLLIAIGQAASADVDLDAICQTATGALLVSFADTESINGTSALDGSIVLIPAASIAYDANGNVTTIAAGSAVEVATEADVNAMIAQSGVRTSVGGSPSTSIDLTALDIDPNGGTWTAPQTGQTLPNLLFAWSGFSNDGAILSTQAGGSIATLNGVQLGSTTATTGAQIGMLPDSTGLGGIMGLGIVPFTAREPLVVENYPTNLITSSTILWTRQETSGATPGGAVFVLVGFGGTTPGGSLPITPLGPIGDLFGIAPFVLGSSTADGGGHASLVTLMPSSLVGTGANLVWQSFDVGAGRLSTPAAMQFL